MATLLSGREAGPTTAGTRLAGLRVGPHAVGFDLRKTTDPTRHVSRSAPGTAIGIAIWYPARAEAADRHALSTLDYRLLDYATPPSEAERQMYERGEADALVGWRHIGIVELTRAQARASLHTRGMGRPGAPPKPGRHPVVMLLGGAYYLSTTAEFLATHGFLVAAAFRFVDVRNDIGTAQFSWYLENSIRDAEWALHELHDDPRADVSRVSALGHGGGGMQALIFAMRNTQVHALVNLDASNFSTRSAARELPFYSPRLMRAPYLYVATRSTRTGQDQFEDFHAMKFADRFEVILENGDVRHHDLSDIGRAVTEPMRLRGTPQDEVQRSYVEVHDMTLRFLGERASRTATAEKPFAAWLAAQHAPGRYAVSAYPRVEAAPSVIEALEGVDRTTAARLKEAQRRDPEAPVFQVQNLLRITAKALAARDFAASLAVADLALELHPGSPQVREHRIQALEGAGALDEALAEAEACGDMTAGNSWQATTAVAACKAHASRLAPVVRERRAP